MAKHIFGLVSAEISDIASDGGMGTALEQLGETVSETAQLATEDATQTDFTIEESDTPVESISVPGKVTLAWSTYNVDGYTMFKLFGGVYTPHKSVLTFGTIVGGSAYVNGTYNNVLLTGGTGQQVRANITVAGGAVTVVALAHGGYGYTVADSLTTANTNLGGTGTGFTVPVATLTNSAATTSTWSAPDTFPTIDKSVRIVDKKGNITIFPRVRLSPKLTVAFSKTKVGQVDITGTILQPTKSGVPKYTITYA